MIIACYMCYTHEHVWFCQGQQLQQCCTTEKIKGSVRKKVSNGKAAPCGNPSDQAARGATDLHTQHRL
ncbi:unnamed protein product [Ectocarpus sp. CCAP 1310/34]|nr:unnamed protein product [Ectocarpus sp. CCAP 1310/34]